MFRTMCSNMFLKHRYMHTNMHQHPAHKQTGVFAHSPRIEGLLLVANFDVPLKFQQILFGVHKWGIYLL